MSEVISSSNCTGMFNIRKRSGFPWSGVVDVGGREEDFPSDNSEMDGVEVVDLGGRILEATDGAGDTSIGS